MMNLIAVHASARWARGLFLAVSLVLVGCAAPRASGSGVVYDFGPGALSTVNAPARGATGLPALELAPVRASAALNSPALMYRLAYADVQQLKPYAQARWSMPPAQLVGQRVRAALEQQRPVWTTGGLALARPARPTTASNTALVAASPALPPPTLPAELLNLHLELEEFSQVFDAPQHSAGVLRLRATVTQRSFAGESLVGQRSFAVTQVATTPDASGGVHALGQATEQVVAQLAQWLAHLEAVPSGTLTPQTTP